MDLFQFKYERMLNHAKEIIENGTVEELKELIGNDPYEEDGFFLAIAANAGNQENVRYLHSINSPTDTAVYELIKDKNLPMLDFLLSLGGVKIRITDVTNSMKAGREFYDLLTEKGIMEKLKESTDFSNAITTNNIELVKKYIEEGININEDLSKTIYTINSVEMLNLLVDHGFDLKKNYNDILRIAIIRDNKEIIDRILDFCKENDIELSYIDYFTEAINERTNPQFLKFLIEKRILPSGDSFYEAIAVNNEEVYNFLCNFFHLPNDIISEGKEILNEVRMNNEEEKRAEAKEEENEEAMEKKWRETLDKASEFGEKIEEIMKEKTELFYEKLKENDTDAAIQLMNENINYNVKKALKISIKRKNKRIVELILEKHKILGHRYSLEEILESIVKSNDLEIFNLFLRHNFDFRMDNDIAINIAAKYGSLSVLQALLDLGLNPNGKNESSVISAVEAKKLHALNILLNGGADVHIRDEFALRIACLGGTLDIVKRLVQAGANLHAKDEECLNNAFRSKRFKIAYFLIENGAIMKNALDRYVRRNFSPAVLEKIQEAKRVMRQRLAENEEKNEEKRRIALQEYKDREEKEENNINRKQVKKHCIQDSSLLGDDLMDSDPLTIFMFKEDTGEVDDEGQPEKGPPKGDCYIKRELAQLMRSAPDVTLWDGPPSGVISDYAGRRDSGENMKVYKLPFSGVWVTENALQAGLQEENKFVFLKGEKRSIGSSFGSSQLHGQWGGHWAPKNTPSGVAAEYVEDGNAYPDERYMVYDLENY